MSKVEPTQRALDQAAHDEEIKRLSDEGTGCVVPEAVRRLPTVMRQDAQLEQDQGDQRVAEAVRYYADELDRAIAEQGGQRLPEDWKLVPVEPTDAMLATAKPAIDNYFEGTKDAPFEGSVRAVYQSMLAAAPQPEHGESDE